MSKEFNEVCRKVGSEGIVLLKNENQVLPLQQGRCVSVSGIMSISLYQNQACLRFQQDMRTT